MLIWNGRTRAMPLSAIEIIAEQFRGTYMPHVRGAADLELVIEKHLDMSIVPRRGLRSQTKEYGYIAIDGRTIFVDADFQMSGGPLYQAFLAHELSHRLVHSDLLRRRLEERGGNFFDFHAAMTEVEHAMLEQEARDLSMCIQMPRSEFCDVFNRAFQRVLDRVSTLNTAARALVTQEVVLHFGVDYGRAERRLLPAWREAVLLHRDHGAVLRSDPRGSAALQRTRAVRLR